MKRITLATLFISLIFSAYADSNLIAGKEIWEPGESAAPSSVGDYDDDDNYDDEDYRDNWSKPEASEGNPSMFSPKGSKDVFPSDE